MKVGKAVQYVERMLEAMSEADRRQFAHLLVQKCEPLTRSQLEHELELELSDRAGEDHRPVDDRQTWLDPRAKRTPIAEQKAQMDFIVEFVRLKGPSKVVDVVDGLISNHSAIASRPSPRNTATGRVRTAIGAGIVQVNGGPPARSKNGQVQVHMDDVLQLPREQKTASVPAQPSSGSVRIGVNDTWLRNQRGLNA